MAPVKPNAELSNVPLADYFFISGIESTQVYDEREQRNGTPAPAVDETIEEDKPLSTESRPTSPENGKRNSGHRLSYDARKSIGSILEVQEPKIPDSQRSSATIRAVQFTEQGLNDEDFEQALRKFASERETFMEELQFSAGTVIQKDRQERKKPRPKTQRIIGEDAGGARGGVGSLRRRISTMGSVRRSPSVNRQSSIRTSKRLSGYNSVIPAPEPFRSTPNMHPLKRPYEPVLLDRYPPKESVEEVKRRTPFPDFVPMFAFPNDVNVVTSDERPKTTWHGFAMTSSDNSRLFGICLTVWLPLNHIASTELERQCDAWRKANMSGEERELAKSLGERLVGERAKLSRLLAELPSVPSGSDEREQLDDEISAVEEKIGLMTDMLRPVRHAAASKIDGLTEGETGFWIPRVYGVLGRDPGLSGFWKEWLKAVVVPMTNGGVLRVPPSSPKTGMWQPLERYVVNLCSEALSPINSITQVEIAIRELRLYARKEAINELPGSHNTDLYALFRSLSISNIVILFEYIMSESRVILLSSHTAMLYLVSQAIDNLLYPFKWAGVFIPVLPRRLITTLEAPCPYIIGVEKRYEHEDWPDDDFVLVDLDKDLIESTARPTPMPRQQRRKLTSLLQLAAPHHIRYGVPVGPPEYAKEAYPYDAFSSENTILFSSKSPKSTLATYVALNSTSFGTSGTPADIRPPIFNAFLQARNMSSRGNDRPGTSGTSQASPPSPTSGSKGSPTSNTFPPLPATPVSRSDSGYALQANLREKRSGHFNSNSDASSRRSSSFGIDRMPTLRRPSQPFTGGHAPTLSTSTLANEYRAPSSYAPSVYAQSTLAASTIMPGMLTQAVRNTDTTQWVEGHCMQWRHNDDRGACSVCDEKSDEGIYKCSGCNVYSHTRCVPGISIVCPAAFRPDQIRAAFVRCFASLLYTYRRYMQPASKVQARSGLLYSFNMDGFLKSLPHENQEYITMLQQTQAFNEFIHERETKRSDNPTVRLFDQIILSKKNRGRSGFLSKSTTDFLSDTSDHLWRTAAAAAPSSRFPGDYRQITSRIPAKLDPSLMKEPRVIQGVPRVPQNKARRKPIPSMLGNSMTTPQP